MNDLMTKSFLSYTELKKQVDQDLEAEYGIDSSQLNPLEEPNLSQFFLEVSPIKAVMEEIASLFSDFQALHEETKSTHSAKVLRGLRDRIESDIVAILKKAKIVKERLGYIDRANVSNRKISELYKEGSSVDRTRISVTNGLKVKFRELMNEFQFLREKIVSDYKNDLKRRYYTTTGEEPSEEVIEKVVSGSVQIQEFQAKGELDMKAKESHDAVMDLQRSLKKLHQVFLDMAVFVETQGEKVDDIEQNVATAASFVSGGTKSLYYANQSKKKSKAWLYWVWAVMIIILLVCFISILSS